LFTPLLDAHRRGRVVKARLSIVVLALASGACRRTPEPQRKPDVAPRDFSEPEGAMRFSGAITLRDGTRVEDVLVEPAPLRPGESLRVSFVGLPATRSGRVVVSPPRVAGRQLAKGGPQAARAPQIADDPRGQAVPFRVGADTERIDVQLELPAPWHPATAVITLELDGATHAVEGPRTHDGAGVLAHVPVERVPTTLQARRATDAITIDGRLDEALWQTTPVAVLVHSLDGEPVPGVRTQVQLGWDERHLYVGARLEDDDIWSDYTEHDDPLWKQEVFEVFIFGDAASKTGDPSIRRDYLELQVSARGVTFDARFPHYRKGDEAWDSTWTTAVDVRGDMDDRRGQDEGWTVEAAIDWEEICAQTSASCPPQAGARLRLNLFRLERPREGGSVGLALSPTLVPDFHAPENAAIVELAS
jgi:hypothetical protein